MNRRSIEIRIELVLRSYCTGADDHDYENCEKCAEMRDELVDLFLEMTRDGRT